MQFVESKVGMVNCPTCGKATPKRDLRSKNPQYCSRVCSGISRFSTRYRGSISGPADRPQNLADKGKWQG